MKDCHVPSCSQAPAPGRARMNEVNEACVRNDYFAGGGVFAARDACSI
jgi:hypothetical protein